VQGKIRTDEIKTQGFLHQLKLNGWVKLKSSAKIINKD
jgi:hypothetical protein